MNAWVPVPPCGVSIVGGPIAMEAVTVTGPNACAPLVGVQGMGPDGGLIILVINGLVFMPVGPNPPFSVSGLQITWNAANSPFGFGPLDSVACAYSYGGLTL